MRNWLDSIVDWLKGIAEGILSLPRLILEGIKDIFIPDTEYIDTAFDGFLEELKFKFQLDTEFFENLFTSEKPVNDTYVDYNIQGVGGFRLKVFDTTYLVQGVQYFRPFIRGFLVLMMALYHIRQLIGFFGYDSGVVTGRSEHIASAKKGQE